MGSRAYSETQAYSDGGARGEARERRLSDQHALLASFRVCDFHKLQKLRGLRE